MSISVNSNPKPQNAGPGKQGIDDDLFNQFAKTDASQTEASSSSSPASTNKSDKAEDVKNSSGDRRLTPSADAANKAEAVGDAIAEAIKANGSQFGSII